jgi:hypothetical protein
VLGQRIRELRPDAANAGRNRGEDALVDQPRGFLDGGFTESGSDSRALPEPAAACTSGTTGTPSEAPGE